MTQTEMDKVAYDQKVYDLNLQAAHRLHDRLNEIESHLNDGALKASDMGLRTSVARRTSCSLFTMNTSRAFGSAGCRIQTAGRF
jgi:hypothetical protein